jgi:hypothetical protein
LDGERLNQLAGEESSAHGRKGQRNKRQQQTRQAGRLLDGDCCPLADSDQANSQKDQGQRQCEGREHPDHHGGKDPERRERQHEPTCEHQFAGQQAPGLDTVPESV